jgi:pimeloyl-ACP methyl ester carboxylesterase
MTSVAEQTIEVPGWADDPWPVVVRSAPGPSGGAVPPVLYVHGVPTSGADWVPFLERTGGHAPDLPGFGLSSKRGDGDFTLDGYARFTGALVDALGLERVSLVVHDWGAAALAWAAAHPERVERLVVINAVPLLAGYRWHRMARLWRARGVGEVVIGTTTGFALRRLLPPGVGDVAADHFDQGTQRAILRLYRSAPPQSLAAHEPALGALKDVPSLVVWGKEDPYIATKYAERYADALGGATVRVLAGAGHWPWIEDDAARDGVVQFLR